MYDGIKKAVGPTTKTTAPLKSSTGVDITDRFVQLMERWIKYYSDIYSRQNVVTDEIDNLPTLTELDDEPTLEENGKAIDLLSNGKASGQDGKPPEAIKAGKDVLLKHLHELLCLSWASCFIPQYLKDANIITLYKNKDDRVDCNNYRGVSFLSVVGKVFAKVALGRLKFLAERVYPEFQCGFKLNRSTIDMIFSLRQLQEKCREQQKPLYIAFIDLTKAFDLVSRSGLFKLLQKIGCPLHLLNIIRSFHENIQGTVLFMALHLSHSWYRVEWNRDVCLLRRFL